MVEDEIIPPLGQLFGPIIRGPRSYAPCFVCTIERSLLEPERKHPVGWLRHDLKRHLRDYHKVDFDKKPEEEIAD